MARIKGGLNAKKKHNRVLKLAKGYRGARSKQYRVAKQSVMNGFVIYRSMEDITKRRELTLYWQNRRAKRERKYEQSSMCRFV